ncbi:MAG: hypothetical protein ACC682_16780 [Gemmatimonadota bacterium]
MTTTVSAAAAIGVRPRNCLALVVSVLWTTACASESAAPPVEANVVRDSAGIRVVESSAAALSPPWRLSAEPVITIDGGGPPDETPLDPMSVFQTRSGLLVVGDGNQSGWHALLVYDLDGAFLRKMGGSGEGPGEFGQLWFAAPYRGDSLVAMDMRGATLKVFDELGEYARQFTGPRWSEVPPKGTYGFVPGFGEVAYSDGSFLGFPYGTLDISDGPGPAWYRHAVLRLDPSGAVWDTLGVHAISERYWDGQRQSEYQFGANAFAVPNGRRTVLGDAKTFEYRLVDEDWNVEMIVRRSHTPVPVTQDDRDELLEWWIALLETSPEYDEESLARYRADFFDQPFAPTKPAYDNLLVDDEGHVWVQEYRWVYDKVLPPHPRPGRWSVFAPDGTWLTSLETPPDVVVRSVSHDRVFGFRVDAFDVKHIVVYDLIK